LDKLRQYTVPEAWKISRRTPLHRTLPVCNIESDVRPIAITTSVANVTERIVSKYFDFSLNECTHSNRFVCVRGHSARQALLQIMHDLFQASA
jgi:hypothetical protein